MKIAERFVFAKGSGGINRTIWGMQGLYIRVHQVILDWGVGVYNTIQLSYLWGATVASLGRSSALKRMQGLSYACTRCCSSGMVVPTGCYWVALILGAARVLRATPASASCALCQAGWFSQELNYSQFQLPFLLYCNIFSYIVPPDHSVIFRKPDLPIRLILR